MQLLKGIRLLEQGCEEKDWDKVFESYELISGEGLQIAGMQKIAKIVKQVDSKKKPGRPKKVTKTPDTPIPSGYPPEVKWIQDELEESLLANDGFGKSQAKLVESVIKQNKPQKQLEKVTRTEPADISEGERRQPRTEPVRFRGNSFVDDGSLAIEDKLIDKKLKKGKGGKGWKRAQPRPQHEFVQVDCGTRSCNTTVEVSPELYMADTTYFCPKCLSKKR